MVESGGMLGCVDDSPFVLRDSYRSEVTLMCPVAKGEVTTLNPKYDWKSVPPFFQFDCSACGEHDVVHLHRPKP